MVVVGEHSIGGSRGLSERALMRVRSDLGGEIESPASSSPGAGGGVAGGAAAPGAEDEEAGTASV